MFGASLTITAAVGAVARAVWNAPPGEQETIVGPLAIIALSLVVAFGYGLPPWTRRLVAFANAALIGLCGASFVMMVAQEWGWCRGVGWWWHDGSTFAGSAEPRWCVDAHGIAAEAAVCAAAQLLVVAVGAIVIAARGGVTGGGAKLLGWSLFFSSAAPSLLYSLALRGFVAQRLYPDGDNGVSSRPLWGYLAALLAAHYWLKARAVAARVEARGLGGAHGVIDHGVSMANVFGV